MPDTLGDCSTHLASSTQILASSDVVLASHVLGDLVECEIDRVLTQYRESPHLLGAMRIYLGEVMKALLAVHVIPTYFDLNTAVGDQLTLLGKRLGFPRDHCGCTIAPMFGFSCGDTGDTGSNGIYEVVGFCEGGTWINCRDTGASVVAVDEDEHYRDILKARRYQTLGLYDIESLKAACEHIWGDTVHIFDLGGGKLCVVPGRALTDYEREIRFVAFRALPIAPGIKAMVSDVEGDIFGFGDGFSGFCGDAEWLCPTDPHAYDCAI